jgi:hypothetical protein
MSLTANQRRTLIKLINQAENAERAFVQRQPDGEPAEWIKARRKFMNARMRLHSWARERGLDPLTINRQAFALNSIANVLKKTKLAERIKHRAWRKGLEAEKKRALNNLKQFNKNFKVENGKWTVARQPSPKRIPSPKRKTLSPPRARTQGGNFNANEAFARRHTLAPPTNAPVTWSRNHNAKVIRHKTFTEVARGITPAQRKAMASMTANQKQNFVKSLARRPKVR